MSKKKSRPEKPSLQKILLIVPSSLSMDTISNISFQIKRMVTKSKIDVSPDQGIVFTAWCSPRQAYEFNKFARLAIKAKRFSESDGIEEAKEIFKEEENNYYDDHFKFPQDSNRFILQMAAAGMRTAFLDYPLSLEDQEVKVLANGVISGQQEVWNDIYSGDFALALEIGIPAFCTGYKIGVSQ